MDASLILTYRCNSRGKMCHTWQYPSKKEEEITPDDIEKLPDFYFVNITSGEPFLRDNFQEIIDVVKPKTRRIVISTIGMLTDRIVEFYKKQKNKKVGTRISLEGLPQTSATLRGIPGGFDHAFRMLLELKAIGIKDLGVGITVLDKNAKDLLPLFNLARAMDIEFATAVAHNSYYSHTFNNEIVDKDMVAGEFRKPIRGYLDTWKIKDWFRAYIATGIINCIYGKPCPLPCTMVPIHPSSIPTEKTRLCNVIEETMGNIKKSFEEIWNSEKAEKARQKVANCKGNCWMISSVSHIMCKKIWIPIWSILRNPWTYKPVSRNCQTGEVSYG